jgi:DNA-binding response OmpR family regulator/DNA-binding CsgD family transcriptional regulator
METPTGTIMIVDDTPANLALLSDTLAEANYRVLVATDGLSAIEQVAYFKPDIILLDVMMPGIDGFETCRRLKADPLTADIPILFMTGLGELNHLLRGFGEGGLDYIVKPIRPPEVLARIEVHLGLAQARRRAENALQQSAFCALAVNAQGVITWLTPAAMNLFSTDLRATPLTVGQVLPASLLTWFERNRDNTSALDYHNNNFTLKMTACRQAGEYLLLVKKTAGEWQLESFKEALGLTFREAEILMWISRGKTNKEIGLILDSSHRTVNKHLEHIYEKLGVTTRAAAVAMVLQRAGSGG